MLVLAALGIAAWWFLRARNRQSHLAETALQLPAQVTPFTVAAFLRRLQRESGSQLGDGDRQALTLQPSKYPPAEPGALGGCASKAL